MIEQTLDIATKAGAMETFICHPERGGPHPAVLLLMDAPGIREELRDMARRLATVGYYVLLPNLYYRAGRDTIYGPDVLEQGSAERERMRAVRTKMTIPPVMDDVASMLAFVDWTAAAKSRAGRRAWLLHERPVCAGGRGTLSGSRGGGRIVLRHLAGERCRGKPAPQLRQGQQASSTSPAPSTTNWRRLPMVEELRGLFARAGAPGETRAAAWRASRLRLPAALVLRQAGR